MYLSLKSECPVSTSKKSAEKLEKGFVSALNRYISKSESTKRQLKVKMSSASSNPSVTNKQPPLKRNSDDIGWQYGVLIDPNDLNVIQCKLCPKIVRVGIYRLKLHIAGKKGQVRSCLGATAEDIAKCKAAIEESSRVKRARVEAQQEVKDSVVIDVASDKEEDTLIDEIGSFEPQIMGPMDKFTLPLDSNSLGKKVVQPKISEHIMKERLRMVKKYIARWVYIRGISFNAINNDEFDQMVEAIGRFGPGAKKPYQHELQEKLLYEEVNDTKNMLKVLENEWAKNGFSIMTDAWTNQKRRSIFNLCVNCSIGTSFLESKEASSNSHTGELIFQYVNSCIVKVGEANVVQVVTDNASNNMAAKDVLYVERPNIFWSSCATHTINLMLEGIGKMKKFKTIVDQAKALTIFIYSHHRTLALMRKYAKKRDIIRPGVTRFASNFLTLQSLYEKKDQLRMMSQTVETFYHGDFDKQSQVLNDDMHRFKDQPSGGELMELRQEKKAQKNKKMDPLLATEAVCAQGWMVEGGEDEEEGTDVEPVTGLTWKLIAETCGADEVTRLRRSERLNQTREIEDDVHSEPEEEENIDDEEIEFESDQDDVVIAGYGDGDEEGWLNE
ncbi:hypothetical protein PR202_gb25424 [Eleusine coracana subsp. coracana]|uniref:DUF659 domain-containing protein n=1 Tax=Eleusine coracana subsp. coracana TaxID=191504 RepID=A0AAV5FNH9_ELECO|nr:hypothetical protein PR202_gb25424 [Eleusine coracana subsp. coracana]